MANCITLSNGRKLPCKGGSGGFKAVSFLPFSEGIVSGTLGEVATLGVGITAVYRYELKNTGNTWVEEIATDADARTITYNGTLSVVLNKLDLTTRNEIKMLAMGEVIVFLETYNGQVIVLGAESGATLSGGTSESGGAKTDFYGSKLTFSYSESEPYLQLATAAKATYAGIVVEGV